MLFSMPLGGDFAGFSLDDRERLESGEGRYLLERNRDLGASFPLLDGK